MTRLLTEEFDIILQQLSNEYHAIDREFFDNFKLIREATDDTQRVELTHRGFVLNAKLLLKKQEILDHISSDENAFVDML